MGTVAMTGHHLVSPGLGQKWPGLKKEKRKKLQAPSIKLDSD
jgi:hypothetical protein